MTGIQAKKSGYVFGIDLGTTNTVVSVYSGGSAKVLSVDGAKTMPSVISVFEDGTITVGNQAKSRSIIAPENTISSIKRHMAKDWKKVFDALPNRVFTPVDVAAEILRKATQAVTLDDTIDLDGVPHYVVLCVPANFNHAQRKATLEAGKKAGLDVLALLEEPVAAAYAYATEKERDQTVLVYDMGGGTFDVSILKVDSRASAKMRFQVKAKEGIAELGGDDFDRELLDFVSDMFCSMSNIDIFDERMDQGISQRKLREAQQKLLEAVVSAKHELSESISAVIDIPNFIIDKTGRAHHIDNIEISREQFNKAIQHYIIDSKQAIELALESAKLGINDINRILLVGGSTKIPLVRETLSATLGNQIYADTDPDTAVARGAAILGATLMMPDPEVKRPEPQPKFVIEKRDIVNHYLGIEIVGGRFSCLIEKGTEIPADQSISVSKEYTTPQDNMTELAIRVYQSTQPINYVSSPHCYCAGEFYLTGIPAKAKGEERIVVDFQVNSQNLLLVTATSSSGSKKLQIKENMVQQPTSQES